MITNTGAIQVGQWHHVAVTVDFANDTAQIYIDGQLQSTTGGIAFDNAATPDTNSMQGTIGVEENFATSFFRGDIDEARIATVARSADWINAQYQSITGSFAAVGAQQSTGGILNNDGFSGKTPVAATLVSDVNNGTLTLNTDGSFTYAPDANFHGVDSFTYQIAGGVRQHGYGHRYHQRESRQRCAECR